MIAPASDKFVDQVMSGWDQKLDTHAIATALDAHEADVVRALQTGREARRAPTHASGGE